MEIKYVRKQQMPEAELGAQSLAVLDAEKGKYFGLDGTAFRIWQLLEDPISIGELCEKLLGEFDISPDICRVQVREFITQLINEGLISEVDATSDSPKQ